jgi:hypothetical protein
LEAVDHVDDVLAEIKRELVEQNQLLRGDAVLRATEYGTKDYGDERLGSRYVGPDADASLVDHVAKGGCSNRRCLRLRTNQRRCQQGVQVPQTGLPAAAADVTALRGRAHPDRRLLALVSVEQPSLLMKIL